MVIDFDQPADLGSDKPGDGDIVSQFPADERDVRRKTEEYIDGIMPPGIYFPYAGATAPPGFLLCDGQAVSRTTYVRLFNAIGAAYGIGDGSTTFNVPDMRGRVPLGKDDMGGTSANRVSDAAADTVGGTGGVEKKTSDSRGAHDHGGWTQSHTLTVSQMPSHSHGVSPTNQWIKDVNGTGGTTGSGTMHGETLSISSTGGGNGHRHEIPNQAAHSHAVNVVQHYQTCNYIIRT